MKGVQCYELFGGIALQNHVFFIFGKNNNIYNKNKQKATVMKMTILITIKIVKTLIIITKINNNNNRNTDNKKDGCQTT